MNRSILSCTAVLLVSLAPSTAYAQAGPTAAGEIEPETMATLDKMGASLRKLQSFEVLADATNEQVLTTGQKIQSAAPPTSRCDARTGCGSTSFPIARRVPSIMTARP